MLIQSNIKHYFIVVSSSLLTFAFAFFLGGYNAESDNLGICLQNNSELHQQLETARKMNNKLYGDLGIVIQKSQSIIDIAESLKLSSSTVDTLMKESQLKNEKVNKSLKGLQ